MNLQTHSSSICLSTNPCPIEVSIDFGYCCPPPPQPSIGDTEARVIMKGSSGGFCWPILNFIKATLMSKLPQSENQIRSFLQTFKPWNMIVIHESWIHVQINKLGINCHYPTLLSSLP